MPLAKRTRNLFDPTSAEPFKLSRSRLENFLPSFLLREKLLEMGQTEERILIQEDLLNAIHKIRQNKLQKSAA